jgi:hypothetical protein
VEVKSGRGPEHFPTLADVEALREDGYFAKAAGHRTPSGAAGSPREALRAEIDGLVSDLRTLVNWSRG